ncbi:MAG TPA: DNA methyltransferase [Anaerolineaceae bacterium]|nr:DNA methyltransferase [Anaerolineaceae bacterium]
MKNENDDKWEPDEFVLETNTIWSFPTRGSWATHDSKYRGNWSPYIPRNVILRYSEEGDLVLDQFVGSGTTLIEARLLNRECIGLDVNPDSIKISLNKLRLPSRFSSNVSVSVGDARNLQDIYADSIDLICTHPPYANAIQYSSDIKNDLSRLTHQEFNIEMGKVAAECFRVLKKGKFCAILIGDIRKQGSNIPIGFQTLNTFLDAGFGLKEIVIKVQHNCKSTGIWIQRSKKYNFLLLAHEYLFIFKK